jgi:polysaccharide biosynthesis transport protein
MNLESETNLLSQIPDYVDMARRRLWWIVLGTVVLSAVAFTAIALMPDRYEATTTILVDPQKIPERYVTSTVSSDLSARLNTITQEVLSSTRLQQIIDQFKLYADLKNRSREEIIDLMRKDITIQVKQGSSAGLSAFTITYEGNDPVVIAQVTNQLASSFIEWNLKDREQVAVGTSEFLESQLAEAKKNLQEQEQKIGEFKLQHVGEMPDQQAANIQQLAQLQVALQANADALNRLDAERTLLMRTGDSEGRPQPTAAPPTERDRLEAEKRELENQLFDLRRRYTPAHPEVVDLSARLDRLNAQLQSLPPDEPQKIVPETPTDNARLQIIEREMNRLNETQKSINAQIAQYRQRIEVAPVREQQMAELNRNYEVSQEHYRSLLDKTFSAGMAADLERKQEGERFTILDPAQVPEKPIKPHRALLFPAASVFALAFSVGCVIAWDLLFGGMRTQQQVQKLLPPEVPLLATVPVLITPEGRRRHTLFAVSVTVISIAVAVIEAGVLWRIHPHL